MRPSRLPLSLFSFVLLLAAAGGCARLAPTAGMVRPHQRAHLADRIMRVDDHPLSRASDEHVLTTREGAVGGGGAPSGGCGCN